MKFDEVKLRINNLKKESNSFKIENNHDWFIGDDALTIMIQDLRNHSLNKSTYKILEIGTAFGHSMIHFLDQIIKIFEFSQNKVIEFSSIEKDPKCLQSVISELEDNFGKFDANVLDNNKIIFTKIINCKSNKLIINIIHSNATEILKSNLNLKETDKSINNIDFVFIDAMPKEYLEYFKLIYDLLNANSLVFADNTVSHKDRAQEYIDYVRTNFESCDMNTIKGLEKTKINKTKMYIDSMNLELKNLDDNKILIDACCAPCSTASINRTSKFFEKDKIKILISNHNVMDYLEYQKRKKVQEKYYNDQKIEFFVDKYDNLKWLSAIKGYENCNEGGKRCDICFKYRLQLLLKNAVIKKIKNVSTTLTVSPYKNSKTVFSIAKKIFDKDLVQFLFYDFKKNNGYNESIKLSQDMYRQNYCGCIFSKNQRDNKQN